MKALKIVLATIVIILAALGLLVLLYEPPTGAELRAGLKDSEAKLIASMESLLSAKKVFACEEYERVMTMLLKAQQQGKSKPEAYQIIEQENIHGDSADALQVLRKQVDNSYYLYTGDQIKDWMIPNATRVGYETCIRGMYEARKQ